MKPKEFTEKEPKFFKTTDEEMRSATGTELKELSAKKTVKGQRAVAELERRKNNKPWKLWNRRKKAFLAGEPLPAKKAA